MAGPYFLENLETGWIGSVTEEMYNERIQKPEYVDPRRNVEEQYASGEKPQAEEAQEETLTEQEGETSDAETSEPQGSKAETSEAPSGTTLIEDTDIPAGQYLVDAVADPDAPIESPTIEAVRALEEKGFPLEEVYGIGPIKADEIRTWLADPENP